MNLIREQTLNKNFMNWKDLKPQIEKANRQINLHKDECSEFYKRQRMYWNGFKHGIGLAYKIFKATKDSTSDESEVLNIPRVNGSALTEEQMIEQAQQEEYLHNLQWEENMNSQYEWGEDGFCNGFTKT